MSQEFEKLKLGVKVVDKRSGYVNPQNNDDLIVSPLNPIVMDTHDSQR